MLNILKKIAHLATEIVSNVVSFCNSNSDRIQKVNVGARPPEAPTLPINQPVGASQKEEYPKNRFRFSIEKQSWRGAEFALNPEAIKNKVVDTVRDYFPNAMIEAHTELAAFDNGFSTYHRNFFIIVALSDSSMPKEEFEDTVEYLRQTIKKGM